MQVQGCVSALRASFFDRSRDTKGDKWGNLPAPDPGKDGCGDGTCAEDGNRTFFWEFLCAPGTGDGSKRSAVAPGSEHEIRETRPGNGHAD